MIPVTFNRSFAEVVSQPAKKGADATVAAAKTVKATRSTAPGSRGVKATSVHPVKRAKNALSASRVSQRAALLSKRRAAAATAATMPSAAEEEEEPAPEALRGADSEKALDLSLVTPPSPPPPPPPLDLSSEGLKKCACAAGECTVECEPDYGDFINEDGVRLNTQFPDWEVVFPPLRGTGKCRFCKERRLDPGGDDVDCDDCVKSTILQLIVKYAPRDRYYKY